MHSMIFRARIISTDKKNGIQLNTMTQQGSLIKIHIENNFKILYWGFRDLAEKNL